jgi:hypothetical protein
MSKAYAIFLAAFVCIAARGVDCCAAQGQQQSQPAAGYEILLLKKLELKRLENAGVDANHPKVKALKEELELIEAFLKDEGGITRKQPAAEVGRFAVAGSPQGTVMVDTKTGESWFLRTTKAGEMEWVPIKGREKVLPPTPVEKK